MKKIFSKQLFVAIFFCWVVAPIALFSLSKILPHPSDDLMTAAPHTPALFVSGDMVKKFK